MCLYFNSKIDTNGKQTEQRSASDLRKTLRLRVALRFLSYGRKRLVSQSSGSPQKHA